MSFAPNRLTAWIIDELLKSDSSGVELMHVLNDRANGDPCRIKHKFAEMVTLWFI